MGNITANKFLKNMYGVSNYEPQYLNAFGDLVEKLNPITVVKGIASDVKNNTDALYRVNNVYIPKLKAYDNSIPNKLTEYEKLEAEVERLNADPSLVKEIAINSAWSTAYGSAFVNHVNGWINYGNTNKWWAAGTPNEKIIYDALWQTWQQLKASTGQEIKSIGLKYSEHKPYANDILNFERFGNYIGQAGLFPKFKVKGSYTNLDLAERQAELKYRELLNEETDYDNTLSLAKELASKYKLVDLRLDLYENRKGRKQRRENRRNARKEKRDARKRVNAIISELKSNEDKRLGLVKSVLEAETKLKYYTDRNLPTEEDLFLEWDKKMNDRILEMTTLDENVLSPKEKELDEYAEKYAFVERKQKRYENRIARKTYRESKRQLRETYKSLYGKGWRKESNFKDDKLELLADKQESLNNNFWNKSKNTIKARILFAAPLSGFHTLLSINAFDLAGRLLRTKQNKPEIWRKIIVHYRKFGGRKEDLEKWVERHGKQNPLPKYGSPLGKLFYKNVSNAEGDFLNAGGVDDAVIASAITASSTIFVKMLDMIGKNKLTGDKDADDYIDNTKLQNDINFVNNSTEFTQEQKDEIIKYLNEGYELTEAIEKAEITIDTNSINWWLIGGIGLLVLTAAGILIFSKTKKGK